MSVFVFYLAASSAATAVKVQWHPLVLGTPVNIRGVAFALLILTAGTVLSANGRPLKPSRAVLAAAAIAASAIAWPSSQILWCGLPPVLALWLFGIESRTAAQCRIASVGVDTLHVPVGLEHLPAGSLTSTQAFRPGSHHP